MEEPHDPLQEEVSLPPSSTPASKKKRPEIPGEELFYWLQTLVTALVCIVLVFSFLGRITRVVGHSMDPTLQAGELLLVWSLGYEPRAGDIVVLNKTTASFLEGEAIVKRVIATGGQTVNIDYSANTVYVDGVALEEDYTLEPMRELGGIYSQTDFLVPDGSVFLLGDNRNGSSDSRHPELGCVDEAYILGRAVLALFPISKIGFL